MFYIPLLATKRILIIAKIIPIQFFAISFSLKRIIPNKVETRTIATLLIVKIVELSKALFLRARTKK